MAAKVHVEGSKIEMDKEDEEEKSNEDGGDTRNKDESSDKDEEESGDEDEDVEEDGEEEMSSEDKEEKSRDGKEEKSGKGNEDEDDEDKEDKSSECGLDNDDEGEQNKSDGSDVETVEDDGSETLSLQDDSSFSVSRYLKELEVIRGNVKSIVEVKNKELDIAKRENNCLQEENSHLKDELKKAREERDEQALRNAMKDGSNDENRELKRYIGRLMTELDGAKRKLVLCDGEISDFKEFEEFQDRFELCVRENVKAMKLAMNRVRDERAAIRSYIDHLTSLVGNDSGELARTMRSVAHRLESFEKGLLVTLEEMNQVQEKYVLPMGEGMMPSLGDRLYAGLTSLEELGNMWGPKYEEWLERKKMHATLRQEAADMYD
ncbi:hypothetical protein BDQ12DRAFT_729661 [Crucibulum laeve]|uniref:Uncharacterized protein n=1 Tax=Crucibulum laeve TaxID=68775 RepID=A0A5C3LFA4_9AGAR|nr:hypothetical protein BDQ12DRAFT_729661 [Crucibulum laeve]